MTILTMWMNLKKTKRLSARNCLKLNAEIGKYALVFEQKIIGAFSTYQDALVKGYEIAGMKPFLVEQISKLPQVQQFSRVVGFECLTLP